MADGNSALDGVESGSPGRTAVQSANQCATELCATELLSGDEIVLVYSCMVMRTAPALLQDFHVAFCFELVEL